MQSRMNAALYGCILCSHSNLSFYCVVLTQQDPLLADGTTWQCGVCSDFGYSTYLQNDPIYKNMELWTTGSSLKEKEVESSACEVCDSSCALLPPSGSKFPCECGSFLLLSCDLLLHTTPVILC